MTRNVTCRAQAFIVAVGMAFAASTAYAGTITLDFNDSRYLGSVSDPTPASPFADFQRVQNLLSVALGMSDTILGTGGGGANTALYVRSLIASMGSVSGDSCGQGGNGNEHFAIGCDYFIQKYAGTGNEGNAYVWFIGDLPAGTTDIETPILDAEGFQANQWQAFNKVSVPEPGSASLMVLGLLGLALARRKFQAQ